MSWKNINGILCGSWVFVLFPMHFIVSFLCFGMNCLCVCVWWKRENCFICFYLQRFYISEFINKSIKAGRQTSTHLCDVLNKVLAEGESAADEPHSDHMVGQWHDVLVEPDGIERKQTGKSICVSENSQVCLCGSEHLLGWVSVGQRDGKHTDILLSYEVGVQMGQTHQSYEREQKRRTEQRKRTH